jgi:hypothetical protein
VSLAPLPTDCIAKHPPVQVHSSAALPVSQPAPVDPPRQWHLQGTPFGRADARTPHP